MTTGTRGDLQTAFMRQWLLDHPPDAVLHDEQCRLCVECRPPALTEEDARAAGAHVTFDGPTL
jgi:hypothetical protein